MGNTPKTTGDVEVLATSGIEDCDQQITIDCLRVLYNINYKPVATKKNSFGIGSVFLLGSFNFLTCYISRIYASSYNIV